MQREINLRGNSSLIPHRPQQTRKSKNKPYMPLRGLSDIELICWFTSGLPFRYIAQFFHTSSSRKGRLVERNSTGRTTSLPNPARHSRRISSDSSQGSKSSRSDGTTRNANYSPSQSPNAEIKNTIILPHTYKAIYLCFNVFLKSALALAGLAANIFTIRHCSYSDSSGLLGRVRIPLRRKPVVDFISSYFFN